MKRSKRSSTWLIFLLVNLQMTLDKDGNSYHSVMEIDDVTVEDAGKYKVIAKNELGESNASISLNFDGKRNTFYTLLIMSGRK